MTKYVSKLFIDDMKGFNISIDDIEPSNDIFGAIEKAIMKMKYDYLLNRLEVVLNDNLIESKDKLTNYRTILGCRVSYDDLPKEVSFIVREDTKPTYDELEDRIDKAIKHIETHQLCYQSQYEEISGFDNHLLDILKGEENE